MLVGLASNANGEEVGFSFQFDQSELSFGKMLDYDVVNLRGGGHLSSPGMPWVVARQYSIALPSGAEVKSLRVATISDLALSGSYNLVPSQVPVKIGESLDGIDFISPDPNAYSSSADYPPVPAVLLGQTDLAGQSFAVVEVYPLSYVASEKKLTLHSSISIVLECSSGYVCKDYLPETVSDPVRQSYDALLRSIAVNPEDVNAESRAAGASKSTLLPPSGPFDHIMIASSADAPYWNDLMVWHNKKGVRDTILTTSYIYANYSGVDNQERIRNFVIDAHNTWGTLYFLMCGEHGDVPFKFKSYVDESIPSDEYYADFDDDWLMEVFVGRVTADDQTQIARFIAKLMKYETDPPRTGYILDATMLGMDLTTQFDPPYYTLTAGEELKNYIDTAYIPSSFNVTTVYDSYSGNHFAAFISALNAGQNLVNHCDHSNTTVMCTGDRNHGWCMYNSDVDALNNLNQLSVIYSLGCHPNEMDYNDCIAEHFVVYNELRGAVAFTGHTRSGWFYVGDPMSLSSELDYKWWEGLFDNDKYRLGEALAYTKNNSPHGDEHWKYCQWTLNLLGEPEMPIWTSPPDSFLVTYPSMLPVGSSTFSVTVKRFAGFGLSDAYVCLWKDGEIFETGLTNASGNISFDASPETTGTMYVTVTRRNYIPYRGSAAVTTSNLPPVCLTPPDTTVFLCQLAEVCLPVGCDDPNGNLLSGPTLVSGPGTIASGNWCYSPSASELVTLTVACVDSEGLSCESTFEVYVNLNDAPSCQLPNDTTIVQCSPAKVTLLYSVWDPDANVDSCMVVEGPGSLTRNTWSYTPPSGNDTADVLIRCMDDCGAVCEENFRVIFKINTPPVGTSPHDTTIVQCSPATVDIPLVAFDPDGGTVNFQLVSGSGSIVGGNWHYTPTGPETVGATIRCTDTCGSFTTNTFSVTFDPNSSPSCPDARDTTVILCSSSDVNLPLAAADPNNNIISWEVIEGPGSASQGLWHYTASEPGSVDVIVRSTDACGESCDESFTVTFEQNLAPVCQEWSDTTVALSEPMLVQIPFSATDANGNLTGCAVVEGRGSIVNGKWQYTPTESETLSVAVRCSDACSLYCESGFTVIFLFYQCGDANGVGGIDIDDVVLLIGYVFSGGQPPVTMEAGDANCSGFVDIDDIVYLITYVFGGGPAPCVECP
jgi:hypothetical protein